MILGRGWTLKSIRDVCRAAPRDHTEYLCPVGHYTWTGYVCTGPSFILRLQPQSPCCIDQSQLITFCFPMTVADSWDIIKNPSSSTMYADGQAFITVWFYASFILPESKSNASTCLVRITALLSLSIIDKLQCWRADSPECFTPESIAPYHNILKNKSWKKIFFLLLYEHKRKKKESFFFCSWKKRRKRRKCTTKRFCHGKWPKRFWVWGGFEKYVTINR